MPNPMKGQEIATIDVAMVTLTIALTTNVSYTSSTITDVSVTAATFDSAVSHVGGTYVFTYSTSDTSWQLDGTDVALNTYGISITGTASNGDTITVVYAPASELGLTTGTQVSVETELETTDAIKLIVKGVLIAQKRERNTITGTTITLTDNVFNPQLVQMLQGGTITYNADGSFKSYTPPPSGQQYTPVSFTTNLYTAHYDASGLVQGYEKVTYPNCTGQPVAFSAEDDTFSAPEYTIDSAPSTGAAPYTIEYVNALPVLEEADWD